MPLVTAPGLAPVQRVRVGLAELQAPLADSLVAHVQAAAGQQILDVTEAQREAEVQPAGVPASLARAGCIVTIDAMGTQTDIARVIRARKTDYVLCVKDNHLKLAESLLLH